MTSTHTTRLALLLLFSVSFARVATAGEKKGAPAPSDCPGAVTAAVAKLYAGATIDKCKPEVEHGRAQVEVKLTQRDGGKLEIDFTKDGQVIQVEEKVALDAVPAAVMKAFAAKYPGVKAERGEKQTHADGKVFYEIAFQGPKGRKEVTFAEDGTFAEEE
jgi:hypothetical protein